MSVFERDGKGQGRGQPGGSGADQLSELVGVLCEAAGESLGALAHLDVSRLHADELGSVVLALEGMRRSLDAAVGHALGALHEVKGTRSSGLATSKWLAREANLPQGVARRRLAVARTLEEHLRVVDDALSDGVIGWEHAAVFAEVVNDRNAEALAVVAPQLIDAAGRTAFARWAEDVRAVAQVLDPDGTHDPAGDLARNRLTLSPTDGFCLLRGELVGEHALFAREVIDAKADELHLRYQREQEHFPDQPVPPRATLRALALVELLRQAHGVDPDTSRGPRTEAMVVVHPDHAPDDPATPPETQFTDEAVVTTVDGRRLPDDAAGLWGCASIWHTAALALSEHGVPIARTDAYQPPRSLRAAVERRDGGCTFPGCTAKVSWCDAHHVAPWPAGATELTNLVLLCRTHHRHVHTGGWQLTLDPDGWTTWTSPGGTTRTGQRHHRQRHHRQRAGPD